MIDRLKWIEFNWIDVKIYKLVIITFACFLAWIIAKVSEQVFYGSFCANLESSLARCFLWPAHMWRFSNHTRNQEAPLGACKSFIINKLPVFLFSPSIPNLFIHERRQVINHLLAELSHVLAYPLVLWATFGFRWPRFAFSTSFGDSIILFKVVFEWKWQEMVEMG